MKYHTSLNHASGFAKHGTVIGTGFLAWDVVMLEGQGTPLAESVGGTVGNVLSILAVLGAESIPISRLSDDVVSRRIRQELTSLGLCLDFVSVGNCVPQPVVYQINKCRHNSGHDFSFYCAVCGQRAPKYQPIEPDAARSLSKSLPAADVFFFDRVSIGSLEIARACAERGGLVFFEPSEIGDVALFEEALSCSHIIKYSDDRIREIVPLSVMRNAGVLEIRTLGKSGLMFRRHLNGRSSGCWKKVDAFKISPVRDTSGAGDWCTAGVIYSLIEHGINFFSEATDEDWYDILSKAQAFSAINCLFLGARGAMHCLKRNDILQAVKSLYDGNFQGVAVAKSPSSELWSNEVGTCGACSNNIALHGH